MSDFIETSRDGATLCVTIARPEKKNALTGAMYRALIAALAEASAEAAIGAVLLRGKDGVFTAGNDIGDFLEMAGRAETSPGTLFIKALATFDKPLVAAVEGPAIGIGATLCFHCDLVYVAPSARFQMPFVDLGLVPESASSLLAPQRFGYARAAQFILLGETFDAATALGLGLANAIVEPGELHAYALTKAQALAAKPRDALLASRRLLRGDPAVLVARIDEEMRHFREAVRSPQARAAFAAFLQKAKA
jgi:enoyl-CoA hydratase/carnithine racemase